MDFVLAKIGDSVRGDSVPKILFKGFCPFIHWLCVIGVHFYINIAFITYDGEQSSEQLTLTVKL